MSIIFVIFFPFLLFFSILFVLHRCVISSIVSDIIVLYSLFYFLFLYITKVSQIKSLLCYQYHNTRVPLNTTNVLPIFQLYGYLYLFLTLVDTSFKNTIALNHKRRSNQMKTASKKSHQCVNEQRTYLWF